MIPTIIPECGFEKIRDRVAQILATELPSQAYMSGDDLPQIVYLERTYPLDDTEQSAIIVTVGSIKYDWQTVVQANSEMTIYIDIMCAAESDEDDRSDKKAILKLHKLIRYVRGIIEHSSYIRLGYSPSIINGRHITSVDINRGEDNDLRTSVMARLTLEVSVPEINGTMQGIEVGSSFTTVKLNESNLGYFLEA